MGKAEGRGGETKASSGTPSSTALTILPRPPQSRQCASNCARAQRSGPPVPRVGAIPAFACKGKEDLGR